jgi:hypothetical protein
MHTSASCSRGRRRRSAGIAGLPTDAGQIPPSAPWNVERGNVDDGRQRRGQYLTTWLARGDEVEP